jgi:periplasmic divalent cation tolerance protein
MSDDDAEILVLCTAPEMEVAARLARGLVGARLAACVNVLPGLRSFYEWEGEVREEGELQLFIKSRAERYDALEAWLKDNHPYDVPEILALPITRGSAQYLAWLGAQTRAGDGA